MAARDGGPADEWPGHTGSPHAGNRIASGHLAGAYQATAYHTGGYEDGGYPADDYLLDHPSIPGYPALSDHPSMPGYPAVPGYPPLPDHPSMPGYPAPEYWPGRGHPADSHVAHDEYVLPPPVPGPPGLKPAPARPAASGRRARPRAWPVASEDAHWAMLGYLTVPIFGCIVPLAIYLLSLRRSRWLRVNAAQALNVWLTWLLYNISALIVGGLLVVVSAHVAVIVVLPAVMTLWLIILAHLIRAARLASQGRAYALPRWLCSPLIR
jgi:uncharacterized Tic20 family protein